MEGRLLGIDRLSLVRYSIINSMRRDQYPNLTKQVQDYIDMIRSYAIQRAIQSVTDTDRLNDFKTSAQAIILTWEEKSYAADFDLGRLLDSSIASSLLCQFGVMHQFVTISLDRLISTALVYCIYEDLLEHVLSEVSCSYFRSNLTMIAIKHAKSLATLIQPK
jgi:hypothetical protein